MAERQFVKTAVEHGVGLLTLDYPPMNLLNLETFRELHDGLDELLSDGKVEGDGDHRGRGVRVHRRG